MGINVSRSSHTGWAATCAALLAGLALGTAAAETLPVPVIVVGSQPTGAGFEIEATVQAVRQATVAAQLGGNVVSLAVKAGDRVRGNQVVARIDEREAAAALQRSDAAVVQAEGQLRGVQLAAERARELRRQGFVSQAALDVADTELATARAALDQARAARAQSALQRGHATVTAPFDALVLATHVEAGDLAQPGRPLATLYAPGALRAVVQMPASRAAAVGATTQVRIRLPDGTWAAPVRQTVLPATDPVSQTVEVRLDLDPRQAKTLLPGQPLAVRFEGAPGATVGAAAPMVPRSALLQRGELTAVYVAEGERFHLRSVRVGSATAAGQVPVWAGLKTGERVAIDGVRAGLAGAVPTP